MINFTACLSKHDKIQTLDPQAHLYIPKTHVGSSGSSSSKRLQCYLPSIQSKYASVVIKCKTDVNSLLSAMLACKFSDFVLPLWHGDCCIRDERCRGLCCKSPLFLTEKHRVMAVGKNRENTFSTFLFLSQKPTNLISDVDNVEIIVSPSNQMSKNRIPYVQGQT